MDPHSIQNTQSIASNQPSSSCGIQRNNLTKNNLNIKPYALMNIIQTHIYMYGLYNFVPKKKSKIFYLKSQQQQINRI